MKALFSSSFLGMLTLFLGIVILAIMFLFGLGFYDLNFNQNNLTEDTVAV